MLHSAFTVLWGTCITAHYFILAAVYRWIFESRFHARVIVLMSLGACSGFFGMLCSALAFQNSGGETSAHAAWACEAVGMCAGFGMVPATVLLDGLPNEIGIGDVKQSRVGVGQREHEVKKTQCPM